MAMEKINMFFRKKEEIKEEKYKQVQKKLYRHKLKIKVLSGIELVETTVTREDLIIQSHNKNNIISGADFIDIINYNEKDEIYYRNYNQYFMADNGVSYKRKNIQEYVHEIEEIMSVLVLERC